MTRDVAIKLMLEEDIMLNPLIPVEACPDIAKALERIWRVAAESTIRNLVAHNKKPIRMLDSKKNLVAVFPSAAEAAKETGRGVTGIYSAMDRGSRTKDGYYFERTNNKECRVSYG